VVVTDVSGEFIFMAMGLVMKFVYTGCPEVLCRKFRDEFEAKISALNLLLCITLLGI